MIVNKTSTSIRRNAILAHAGRYLDTLGHWSTYQGVASLEEIPARVAQVTYTFTGLAGLLEGQPKLTGLLGAVIAVHALEQVTGGLATAAVGLALRGKPLARYRGLLIRHNPLLDRWAELVGRLPGFKLLEATGTYFVLAGLTWSCQSLSLELADSRRTLTRLSSLSLPHREYLFDRPVIVPGQREASEGERTIPIQRLIDMLKGDETPEAIPGFIGQINELESLVAPLRGAKQFLFMANWLLIDPAELDDGPEPVDYGGLTRNNPSGGLGGSSYRQPAPGNGPRSGWPSTRRSWSPPAGSTPRPIPVRMVGAARPPLSLRQIPQPTPSTNSHRPPPPPNFPEEEPPAA